jgi:hypothetical protein
MALERPPHLVSFWHDVAPINIYAHMSREGGAMALHMFGALFLHARTRKKYATIHKPDSSCSVRWSACASWSAKRRSNLA